MILLVDAGNTRLKWGLSDDGDIAGLGAVVHADKPVDEVLRHSWAALPRPQRIVVANVAGTRMAESLTAFAELHFQREPEFVTPARHACGVTNGYKNPTQLGADRWAGIIAAYHHRGAPVCVIACGTAITVDTVNGEGRHLGGLIAPGRAIMHRALADATAAISPEQGDEDALFAHDTRTAVSGGIRYAMCGFIERVVAEISAQQDIDLTVLLTGGDAEYLQPQLHGRFTLAPNLVLEGLAVLAEQKT